MGSGRRSRGPDDNTRAINTTAIYVSLITAAGGLVGGLITKAFFPDTEVVAPAPVAMPDLNVGSYLVLEDTPL